MKYTTAGLLGLVVAACAGDPTPTDLMEPTTTDEAKEKPTGDSGTKPEIPGPDLEIQPANNYTISLDWTFPSSEARAEFANLTVAWGEVLVDAWGVKRPPSSYSTAVLLQVGVDEKTFVEQWNRDEVTGSGDLLGFWTADIKGRSLVRLTDFRDIKGDPLDVGAIFTTSAGGIFFFGIADFDGRRYDVRLGTFVTPSNNNESRVDIGSGESTVSYSAQLGAPMQTAEVHEFYTADWRDIDDAAFGLEYDRFLVDDLFIAHFENGITAAEIEANPFDLTETASSVWTADIEGDNDIRLELARDAKFLNFLDGFTAGGTWVMGARCETCYGRAPWWLTVVEVE